MGTSTKGPEIAFLRYRLPYRKLLSIVLFGLVLVGIGLHIFPTMVHQGLAGGDAVTSIFWAEVIKQEQGFPEYWRITEKLTSELSPWDFYFTYLTPFLHSFLFVLSEGTGASYHQAVFMTVVISWLAILGLLYLLVRGSNKLEALAAVALLGLAGVKTYRYFFQTGFHFQNLIGDLAVLFVFLFLLSPIRNGTFHSRSRFLTVLLGAPAIVFFFHQQSALILFTTLLVYSPYALIESRKEARTEYFWLSLLLVLAVGIVAGVVSLLILNPSLGPSIVSGVLNVTDFNRSSVLAWEKYGEHLGHALWLLGLLGAGLSIAILLLEHAGKKRTSDMIPTSNYRRHLTFLGIAWLVATIFLSRAGQIGLDLSGARLLWFATYPLVLNAVLGLSNFRRFIAATSDSQSNGGRDSRWSTGEKFASTSLIVMIVLAGILTFPQYESMVFVGPPGSDYNDSTYNGETAAVITFLRERVDYDGFVWIDYVGWRSLIWVRPELILSHNVTVRNLPGSAFSAPLEERSIAQFLQTPIGSYVVKSRSTSYPYLGGESGTQFVEIGVSSHLVILEKAAEPGRTPQVTTISPERLPVTVGPPLALVLVLLIIPGFFLLMPVWSLTRVRWSQVEDGLVLAFPVSMLLLGVITTGATLFGITNPSVVLGLVAAIVVGSQLIKGWSRF